MVVLVTGAREWGDTMKIEGELTELMELTSVDKVAHGGCRGPMR